MRTQGFLAFAVGIGLTVWTCMAVSEARQAQIRSNFERDAVKVTTDTSVRLQTYFDMLLSIKGAFAINDAVSRQQFRSFVGALSLTERYPGFQAIQFVRRVPGPELARFTAAVRADRSLQPDGHPQFEVHPVIERDEHFIIDYTEPMLGNENAFGLDLSALPTHRQAIEAGRDSGLIASTEKITLVQDRHGEPGFVARAPVYRHGMPLTTVAQRREALLGMVAIVFRVNNLMREVIEPALQSQMSFRIHDAGPDGELAATPSDANILFDTTATPQARAIAGLETEQRLLVGQRQWVMRFHALQGGRYSQDYTSVLLIGAGGVVFSTLIAALLIASGRSRTLADGLERSLAELEQQKANAEAAHSDLSVVLETLKRAQNNLITSEKMASLGALVAGIAHELNTPIGNSLLTATALSDMATEFEKLYTDGGIRRSALEAHLADTRQACNIMAGSLRRAADLINSFKQVAVDQTSDQRRRFDLCKVVQDTLATYAAQLRRANCEVRLDMPSPLMLDSYPGSVGQVLANLINNALLHAFDGQSSARIDIGVHADGDAAVLLTFSDDGRGMAPKVLRQIFDPFFSTKMGQGGSGLGMNIVYNIVTGMLGGSIEIDSTPGAGTRVTIRMLRDAPHRESGQAGVNLLL